MELIIVIQGILIALLVWRVINLGRVNETILKAQEEHNKFQAGQVYLNGCQREINSLLAVNIDNINNKLEKDGV